jgi:AcrR family transcriptional regulator
MSHEEIALALGISRPTLYKYFAEELSVGAYQRRAEVIDAMHKAAVAGNVAAQRAYVSMSPQAAVPPQDEKEPKLGKKEQANADAATAALGTDWHELLPGTPVQ